jgi:hypothetical protein
MNTRVWILSMIMASGFLLDTCIAQDLPEGYWSLQQAKDVLDKTRTVTLDPDLSSLTEAERAATQKLIQVGFIFNRIYEDSIHPEALTSLEKLKALDNGGEQTQALLDIYYRSKGPVTSNLKNERVPILPVIAEQPGKNVYPRGMTNELLDPFLEAEPEKASDLLNLRTVVRSRTKENVSHDLAMLDRFPLLDGLHSGLRDDLEALQSGKDTSPWYALPYSVRWAPDIMQAYQLILAAAGDVKAEDPDLAAYLSLRARDIVTDDYEAGDAAWVRGRFQQFNAQICSYVFYSD